MAAQQPPTARSRPSARGDQLVGPYKRLESVGKGSFATVYKGVHPDDNTLVAIKTVQHTNLKGKLRDNLFSEIGIIRDLKHPHIVALINVLESTNHFHLVMEFCQLGDIATFVKKRDKLAAHPVTADMMRKYPNPPGAGFNEVIVRHFAKQLSSALEFLRSKNLVHRDLKPQNLLLNPPPSWIAQEEPENRPYQVVKDSLIPLTGVESLPVLKIADFGFARYLPQTTMAETLCGSPLYMAPEILRYEKYDAKADLWSVGTVLYELMVGKPPFRAANHVELLRRIEKTMDKIKFPEDLVISPEMLQVIRSLLKKMPTERLSWEGFFQSAIIVDDIPFLTYDDKHQKRSTTLESRPDEQPPLTGFDRSLPDQARLDLESADQRTEIRPSVDRTNTGNLTNPTPVSHRLSNAQQRRPALISHSTEPNVQGMRHDRVPPVAAGSNTDQDVNSDAAHMQRKDSVSKPESDREVCLQRNREKALRDAREKAAQDVAFERDYVMVEKRAVEVNAFADELAASPRIHGVQRASPTSQAGAMARRAALLGAPSSAPVGQTTPTRNMQLAVRPEASHQRKQSYERRYDPTRVSATSALAAALNMVNFRLHGSPFSPTPGRGVSPPQGYGPFPAFPATPAGPLLLGDSSKPLAMDEGHKVLHTIEECATRSDVVYGFAEVKYKQLIPIAPSSDNKLGIYRASSSDGTGGHPSENDEDLTTDAIVSISEEALVLFVKALAILTNTINLAGNWWAHKNRGEVIGEISTSTSPRSLDSGKSGFASIGLRINHVVQWARNRFNECLEKSEYVSRRLADAQSKLPPQHPGHPSNHSSETGTTETKSIGSRIHLSSGVTAEKLMYDRALDMSKTAAVNELVGEDLQGCEVSYATAIRLLEAVLEVDDELSAKKNSLSKREKAEKGRDDKDGGDSIEGIEEGDRKTVLKLIESMRLRLTTLRKKMDMQKTSRKVASKPASAPSDTSSNVGGATAMTKTSSR